MRKIALFLLGVLILLSSGLFAGTTGKLAGRVVNTSGQPLMANIIVKEANTGIAANEKGNFIIINLPSGTYTVVISAVGYATVTMTGVKVNVDQTTTLPKITMQTKSIKITGVTVAATQDKISKSNVGSSRQIEMGSIDSKAVSNIEDLIAIQAGVSSSGGELHVRGGRANEVVYSIDGMSVSDPVDGGTALSVDTDAIKDMKVMTGGFTAEYGNAQSGIVNIVTKDGDPFYSGKLELNSDHVFSEGNNMDVVKFAVGGPLLGTGVANLKEKLTFYLNGAAQWEDGRYRDYYKGSPNDKLVYLDNAYPNYNPYSSRDDVLGFEIGDRNYNTYNVNFKTKYQFSATENMTFAIRGDRSTSTPYSHSWRYALQHYLESETNQRQYIMTYDKVLSPEVNYKLKASYYTKETKSNPKGIDRSSYLTLNPAASLSQHVTNVLNGDYGYTSIDENGDGVYDNGFIASSNWTYSIAGLENSKNVPGFSAPGTIWDNFIDDKTTIMSLRGDLEYQINEIHGAKTGFEVIKNHIEKDQLFSFLTIYEDRRQKYLKNIYNVATPTENVDKLDSLITQLNPDTGLIEYIPIYSQADYYAAAKAASGKRDGYKADPWQGSFYLQDKMEWEGMIVNMGLRSDLWYLGTDYQVKQDDGTYRTTKFKSSDRFQMMLSPRLGVSHPISERDVLRFAYNYQNQLPQMQYVFTSKTPEDAEVSDQIITVGNPKLKPQITVTYEVGMQHAFNDLYTVDVTAYYKNIYNYVSTKKVTKPEETNVYWYEYISEDYGSTRGIDIAFDRSMSNFISASLAYSLAWAEGNNSDTVIQDEATNLREFPLDWDIRHNLNFNVTFRIERGEEYLIPATSLILPVDDFTINLSYNIASGTPYTPVSVEGNNALDTNSKRKDATQETNLKISKGIQLGKTNVKVFLDVSNLFKNKNVLTVYPKTGSATADGSDLSDPNTGYTYHETQYMYSQAINNPAYVNNNRTFTLGMSFNF